MNSESNSRSKVRAHWACKKKTIMMFPCFFPKSFSPTFCFYFWVHHFIYNIHWFFLYIWGWLYERSFDEQFLSSLDVLAASLPVPEMEARLGLFEHCNLWWMKFLWFEGLSIYLSIYLLINLSINQSIPIYLPLQSYPAMSCHKSLVLSFCFL